MRQEFHSRVDQVNIGEVHHHHWPDAAPPDDPAMSAQCPQCLRLTWRYSRNCIHCNLDLHTWSARERWSRWRQQCARMARIFRVLARL